MLYRATSKAPKLRSTRGNLVPVMANEEEVVQAAHQLAEVPMRNHVATEKFVQYLGREAGRHIRQRVLSTLELDCDPLVVLYLLFQGPDGIEVYFPAHLLFVKPH